MADESGAVPEIFQIQNGGLKIVFFITSGIISFQERII
jgi:hypothetical protein